MNRQLAQLSFLLVCAIGLAFGQATGRLTGSVTDSTGAAIPGAAVKLLLPGGNAPIQQTTTTAEGFYTIANIRPDSYVLVIETAGFTTHNENGIVIDAGREKSLPAIQLNVGGVTTTVDVSEKQAGVQTSNGEISTTITKEQIQELPQLSRSPLALLTTQAGVSYNGRTNTTINGQRASSTNVTFEGINIQDNYIRTNALDFLPNLLLLDQVGSVTIATTNANPSLGNGSSQVAFVAPSGTNQTHGTVYWLNRNNYFAATPWFNNQRGLPNSFLNQNQIGAALGGHIIKDKLFYYGNYEAFRRRQQVSDTTILLTDSARQGLFTYRDTSGAVRQANVLQLSGLSADPTIAKFLGQTPAAAKVNDYSVGDSSAALLRNTAGYTFLIGNNRTRDNVTGKFDYIMTTKHSFVGTYAWNRDLLDRPDLEYAFNVSPKVANDNVTKFLSTAWRWTPSARLTNELRGGMNIAPGLFLSSEQFSGPLFADTTGFPLGVTTPFNPFRAQGRYTDTYALQDNASYVRGRHNFQFGYQQQLIRIQSFNDAGINPTYLLGISGANTNGLTSTQLPGIASSDLSNANALLALLAGQISSYSQTFNATSASSGYVSGATQLRNITNDLYSGYVQDQWKVSSRLTLNLGLRYDLFKPVTIQNGLALEPQLINNNPIQTLLNPNAILEPASGGTNRPLYNTDKNNFSPNFNFAYDPFGNGKTAIRGGYSLSFINDDTVRAVQGTAALNSGLSRGVSGSGLVGNATSSLPAISSPTFQSPLPLSANYALSATTAIGLVDPNLATPYVQQWNVSIQRELPGSFILDVRYVGNHQTKLFRSFDLNQVNLQNNGFLADFLRAQNNLNLSLAAGLGNNPAYNAAVAGSQVLTVLPQLAGSGNLTNATYRSYIQQGQVGTLATAYATARQTNGFPLFTNPNALAADYLTNYSNATYNALQIDATRRTTSGLYLQFNYTFSKALSDAQGDGQTRVEPFLDFYNAKLEKSRTPFDQTHAFKTNGYYELPFGTGKRFNGGPIFNRIAGNWVIASNLTWVSGNPISIISARGTLNNTTTNGINPSSNNTASTALNKGQLDNVVGYMTGNGPYIINPSAINPADNRGVNADGTAAYTGQIFYNPQAGTVGNLQRRLFNGPTSFGLDAGIEKRVYITERQYALLRMDALNVLNHPTFYSGDQNINSTTFGKLSSTLNGARVLQFTLQVRF